MATLQRTNYGETNVYNDIHKLLLTVKLSHYKTKSFASHEALGRIYDTVNELIDSITEELIGYSEIDPSEFEIGTITTKLPKELGVYIITLAAKIEQLAADKKYCNIENQAQELSGTGAQLKYLSRFP